MTLRLPHELRTIIIFYFFPSVASQTFVKSQWSPDREAGIETYFFVFGIPCSHSLSPAWPE
jgi:hypothetical protein